MKLQSFIDFANIDIKTERINDNFLTTIDTILFLSEDISEIETLERVDFLLLKRVHVSRINFEDFRLIPIDFDKAKIKIKMEKDTYFVEEYIRNLEEFMKKPKVIYQKELSLHTTGKIECEAELDKEDAFVSCISLFNSNVNWNTEQDLKSYLYSKLVSDRWVIVKDDFSFKSNGVFIKLVFRFYNQCKIPDIIRRLKDAIKEFLDIYLEIFFYNSNLLYKDEKIEYNLSKL